MALAVAPANDRKRVKVYELKNNDWFDRGTGFCRGVVVNEEAKILVASEDDPSRQLLETRISKDDGYQKQQDTLIVWTEANGTDMALSFQEPEGCGSIWEFVNEIQQRLQALAGADDALSEDNPDNLHSIMLPPPDLGNLPELEAAMRNANNNPHGREALAKFVITQDYIAKLTPLVEMAEDLESLADLHRLCSIMKMLILLNDTAIIEYVVTDEVVLGVVGALEYDPDFPCHKANHRQYLSDESKFKEVVRIEDQQIKKKIHYTYRLQYLKDVVLARILDDPTFSVLNSLIFFHQVDIVQHLQSNAAFLKELFGIFSTEERNLQRKKEAVLFIQQCCAVAKSLQAAARAQLYQNFIGNGLLDVIQYALKHQDAAVRVAGTDILVALIDHDALMVRSYIFKAIQEKTKPLTDTLIELLLIEVDLGVKSQMADAIKVLLDPNANSASIEAIGRTNSDYLAKVRSNLPTIPQADTFIQTFYDESAKKLFQPLKDLEGRKTMDDLNVQEVSLYVHLVETLCFFIRQYSFRSKFFILSEGLAARVAQLMLCPEKHLKLTALKYFRTCIGLHDEFHNRQIIQNHLFDPILNILYETMPRDNLLNSACLELFEFIKRENIKLLVIHLVETYREKLQEITYVDTFQTLIMRYDQMHEPPTTQEIDQSFTSADSETPGRNANLVNGGRWQGLKEADAEEEAYFGGSDDEDDALPNPVKPIMNGASPVRPLVNYPDDDAEDDTMDILATSAPTVPSQSTSTTSAQAQTPDSSTAPSSAQASPTPPERLSEKRRREDDEEDELAKISTSSVKRRSSTSSLNSTGSTRGLRRKNAINSNKENGPPKKMSISIGLKSGGGEGNEGD